MNTKYSSPGLKDYFAEHRAHFDDFYPSEREALQEVGIDSDTSLLDIGCACGGLGTALNERFGLLKYTGIDIHVSAAHLGATRVASFGGVVVPGDVLEAQEILKSHGLSTQYDLVVSLSALDWNASVAENVLAAWTLVKPGGSLLLSLRLHPEVCLVNDPGSVQPTSPSTDSASELAPYVVISIESAVRFAKQLRCENVRVTGYWGEPSSSARTSVDSLIFVVATLRKPRDATCETRFDVASPSDLARAVHHFAGLD